MKHRVSILVIFTVGRVLDFGKITTMFVILVITSSLPIHSNKNRLFYKMLTTK